MMPKQIVGLDLDDVLIDFNEGLKNWHNATYGTRYERRHIVQHDLSLLWGCAPEEAKRRVYEFYQSDHHDGLLPVAGALDAVRRLAKNHALAIITSRPGSMESRTLALIQKHFPPVFEGVHFLNQYGDDTDKRTRTKDEVCRALGVAVFMDDVLHNVATVAQRGIPTLLFDVPWSPDPEPAGVTRVFGWPDALAKIAAHLSQERFAR